MDATDLYPEMLRPYDARVRPLPAPTQNICDGPVYTICVNEFWWSHVSGQIARLLYRDAWAGTDDQIDAAIQSIYKILNVGMPTMGCGCGDSGLPTRVNSDGVYQVSYDGGVTWVDAPQLDPRNTAILLPPLTGEDGDDKKCQSAANVVGHLKNQADQLANDVGAWGSVSALIAVVIGLLIFIDIIGTLGAATPLIMGVVGALLTLGRDAFVAAMTSTVYDILNCIVFCHCQPDGSFTQGDLDAIYSDVSAQIGGAAEAYIHSVLAAWGIKGLTNAARTGSGRSFDCDTCHCDDTWCFEGDFTLESFNTFFQGYTSDAVPSFYNTSYIPGVGWQTGNGSPNYSIIQIELCQVPGLRHFEFTASGSDNYTLELLPSMGAPPSFSSSSNFYDFDGTETLTWLAFGRRDVAAITHFHMDGVGSNPFGLNNC